MSKQYKPRILVDMINPIIPPPRYFGFHPGYQTAFRRAQQNAQSIEERFHAMRGAEVPVTDFCDSRHPETILIPRNRPLMATDTWGEYAVPRLPFFFSSHEFWINQDEHPLWKALHHPSLFRMQGISQLGALLPAQQELDARLVYPFMPFRHSRWLHLMLAAAMADVLLARAGWDLTRRSAPVLTVATHDIALPAGGDTVKRIDPEILDEEAAYASTMDDWGLGSAWRDPFNFDLSQAAEWVLNKGFIGQLLDIVDKLSYVTYDCYYLGYAAPGSVRSWCIRHPLVMNVWLDCRCSADERVWGFTNPQRLFNFLMLRALEHSELLLNPASRFLDTHLAKFVRPLYQNGQITAQMLRQWTDDQLIRFLEEQHAGSNVALNYVEPHAFAWKRFGSPVERQAFVDRCGHTIDHCEDRTGFNTGLEWPVFTDATRTQWKPLHACLTRHERALLEHQSQTIAGYYAYWKRPDMS